MSKNEGAALAGETSARETSAREHMLAAAVKLFWARGAETASYNDIVAATGMSRKALYSYWPDKDALIGETLDVYYRQLMDFVDVQMAPGGAKALKAFWDAIESGARTKNWQGCYLSRTACGPLRATPKIATLYQDYFDHVTKLIARAVAEGQAGGDIDGQIDPDIAGMQSFALLGAISALGAQSGYTGRVGALFKAGRASCGIGGL